MGHDPGRRGRRGRKDARPHRAQATRPILLDAGVYDAHSEGHLNRYQLFSRAGHRADATRWPDRHRASSRLRDRSRQRGIAQAALRALRRGRAVGLDNRRGVFRVHRASASASTASAAAPTGTVACRFGVDDLPNWNRQAASPPRAQRGIRFTSRCRFRQPLGRTAWRFRCCARRSTSRSPSVRPRFRPLGAADGWVRFGRELNATEIARRSARRRTAFRSSRKQLALFHVDLAPARHVVPAATRGAFA